jgi:hypothetical protein
MDIERDGLGHEHVHATLRDHTGVQTRGLELDTGVGGDGGDVKDGMTVGPGVSGTGLTTRGTTAVPGVGETEETAVDPTEAAREEKRERKERRRREKEERERENAKGPVYRPLGGALPPPRSERYVCSSSLS